MLTHERLTTLLDYDPNSGVFTWAIERQYNAQRGQRAGSLMKRGYWKINIDGKMYYAHVLAWFYVHREWPRSHLDHVDRNRQNNSFSNLRLATPQQNAANMFRTNQSTSGYKGVCWHKKAKKWMASIKFKKRPIYLGLYDSASEAHTAYLAKAKELFGEFA